jgi:hypothetical protein
MKSFGTGFSILVGFILTGAYGLGGGNGLMLAIGFLVDTSIGPHRRSPHHQD